MDGSIDMPVDGSTDISVDAWADASMDATECISVGESAERLPQLVRQENRRELVTNSVDTFLKLVMVHLQIVGAIIAK